MLDYACIGFKALCAIEQSKAYGITCNTEECLKTAKNASKGLFLFNNESVINNSCLIAIPDCYDKMITQYDCEPTECITVKTFSCTLEVEEVVDGNSCDTVIVVTQN